MSTALITPSILQWARMRAKLEPEELAAHISVKSDRLIDWEKGKTRPTFRQAQQLAKKLYIPFGYLFLPKPPVENAPIPDLRTIGSQTPTQISPNLRDLLTDVLYKQAWYRDYQLEQGAEPLPFIGRFSFDTDVKIIATDLMETLQLTVSDRKGIKSLNHFVERAEDAGIWVMRSGIVGTNTHRGLDVDEFRGFAISDDIAPLIFINGKDATAAQVFTLAHELAHLWLGQSGISHPSLNIPAGHPQKQIEQVCNAVAAELLVPEDVLRERWLAGEDFEQNVKQLADLFQVSKAVVARRAFDAGFIGWNNFSDYYQQQVAIWREQAATKSDGGGNYYHTVPVRNGRNFTETILRNAAEQRLLLRDAGRLLGVHPGNLSKLTKEINH